MRSLTKPPTTLALTLAVAALVAGCGRRDESAGTAAAPPGTTYSPAPGAEGGVGTFTDSTQFAVDVIGVDEKARTITVTAAESSQTVDRPGRESPAETGPNTGARGAAGAIADRRTLPVDSPAAEHLSKLKAGDRVTLTCTLAAAGTGTGTGTAIDPTLDNCARVAAITPPSGGGDRGR